MIMWGCLFAGVLAGFVNGIFGGAGGMVLIPALSKLGHVQEDALFPASVRVMLIISAVTLALGRTPLPWSNALPYLLGGTLGGAAAGIWGDKLPVLWLHRFFGVMLLWGGVRYLW